jgi:hypothetical protein
MPNILGFWGQNNAGDGTADSLMPMGGVTRLHSMRKQSSSILLGSKNSREIEHPNHCVKRSQFLTCISLLFSDPGSPSAPAQLPCNLLGKVPRFCKFASFSREKLTNTAKSLMSSQEDSDDPYQLGSLSSLRRIYPDGRR